MTRFTDDNTEGYSADDLAELNRRFETARTTAEGFAKRDLLNLSPTDLYFGSLLDHIAESVLAEFDTERAT